MFKPGDSYIHFTKYGSVNRGIVKSIGNTTCICTTNLCVYTKMHIINDSGILYDIDGSAGKFYLVNNELTEEQANKLETVYTKIRERKL
jgi:hypothetical protein